MKQIFGWSCVAIFFGSLLYICSLPVHASSITGLEAKVIEPKKIAISIHFDEQPIIPENFSITEPAQIILDFKGIEFDASETYKQIKIANIKNINVISDSQNTRVILDLDHQEPYDIKLIDNSVNLILGEDSKLIEGQITDNKKVSVTNIDFKRKAQGVGILKLQLSSAQMSLDTKRKGNEIYLRLLNVHLPEKFIHRLDVSDFATAVTEIISTEEKGETLFKIIMHEDFDYIVYQMEDILNVEISSVSKNKKEEQKYKDYKGERLSLNFQNIEVRAVLQLLADFTNLNLVASDSVKGNITLKLDNVPWDQAMAIILQSKGLDMREMGNVIMVAPTQELAARERLELEASQQVADLAPLRSEFVQINYAKAQSIAELLKGDKNTLLSSRGNVSVDERTNTLLLQDTNEKINEIRKIILQLDTPVKQVEISARIVNAKKSFSKNLGIRWGSKGSITIGNKRITSASNLSDSNATAGTDTGETLSNINDRLNVDLGVIKDASSIAFSIARLGKLSMLDLELSAAQSENLTHVIASPKIITSNQKEAVIKQGKEVPYLEASSSGATSVSFKDAVLELKVIPHITPDNRVIMDLTVKQDVISEFTETVSSDALPIISTKAITTQVLVNNGETIVLGGIYEQDKNNNSKKVPFFGDLPFVNFLFKNTSDSDERNELLIFVTPTILAMRNN